MGTSNTENTEKIFDVAIIGAGGAGQMAILRAALNQLDTLAFLGDAKSAKRSRHTWVHDVENIPGMFEKKRPITATTKEVLKFITDRPELNSKLETVKQSVTQITKTDAGFQLKTQDKNYSARYVVLCTGTMDIQPLIQGSMEPIFPYANRGEILYCIRCDGHKTIGQSVAVLGHSTNAGWIAVMLKERYHNPKLWVLSNGRPFEGSMEIRGLLEKYDIPILEESIQEILGDPKEKLAGFQVGATQVPATMAFAALGSIVYNELATQLGVKLNEREHILTNEKCETSIPGFYAAGDLVAGKKKQVYTSWDMAVDAIDDIDGKIRQARREKLLKSV